MPEGDRELDTYSVMSADRVSKASVKSAKARARKAKLDAKLAALEARRLKAEVAEERAKTDEDLARAGLKRSFWTGRVVPVRGSQRARPHSRRLLG